MDRALVKRSLLQYASEIVDNELGNYYVMRKRYVDQAVTVIVGTSEAEVARLEARLANARQIVKQELAWYESNLEENERWIAEGRGPSLSDTDIASFEGGRTLGERVLAALTVSPAEEAKAIAFMIRSAQMADMLTEVRDALGKAWKADNKLRLAGGSQQDQLDQLMRVLRDLSDLAERIVGPRPDAGSGEPQDEYDHSGTTSGQPTQYS